MIFKKRITALLFTTLLFGGSVGNVDAAQAAPVATPTIAEGIEIREGIPYYKADYHDATKQNQPVLGTDPAQSPNLKLFQTIYGLGIDLLKDPRYSPEGVRSLSKFLDYAQKAGLTVDAINGLSSTPKAIRFCERKLSEIKKKYHDEKAEKLRRVRGGISLSTKCLGTLKNSFVNMVRELNVSNANYEEILNRLVNQHTENVEKLMNNPNDPNNPGMVQIIEQIKKNKPDDETVKVLLANRDAIHDLSQSIASFIALLINRNGELSQTIAELNRDKSQLMNEKSELTEKYEKSMATLHNAISAIALRGNLIRTFWNSETGGPNGNTRKDGLDDLIPGIHDAYKEWLEKKRIPEPQNDKDEDINKTLTTVDSLVIRGEREKLVPDLSNN